MPRHNYLLAAYNNAAYIPETIASIRAQYASDGEFAQHANILIIDDASDDATPGVLAKIHAQYGHVRSLRNASNLGVGVSRNLLLDWLADDGKPKPGDLISFVDADDVLPPGTLRTRVNGFSKMPEVDCLGGQLEMFYEDGQRESHAITTFPIDPDIERIASLFECHFYGANCTFRAHVFDDPDVRWPSLRRSNDWTFFSAHPEIRRRNLPDVTLRYRRHATSITATARPWSGIDDLRRSIRSIQMEELGFSPSREQSKIMDAVGYLSFRMRWNGLNWSYVPDAHMPSFSYISENPDVLRDPESFFSDLDTLFLEMISKNNDTGAFDRLKFKAFLRAMARSARKEITQSALEVKND